MRTSTLSARFELTLSAASGLALRDGVAHVIADDRLALYRYRIEDGAPLAPVPLSPAPADAQLEKRDKPDLETLIALADGSLLALGSGSRPNRERGFLISPAAAVQPLDLSPLYGRLRQAIPALNIEGACRHAGALVLAHRGVGAGDVSRLIRLDAHALDVGRTRWGADLLETITPVGLGELDGVPLGITDLACDANGILHYLAAAEATDDPYLDGVTRGSVIGCIETGGRTTTLARLHPPLKAEGLAWLGDSRWLIVTDADDPARRATLYELDLH